MNSRIALSKLEIPLINKKLKQHFNQADIDNDNLIDLNQFIKSVKDIKDDIYLGKEFEKFREAFCNADENNKGLISADQFRLLFCSVEK